jgi:asparagine synthase (glutamine-hydrolysing)
MNGLVPDPVLARKTKGNYLGEEYLGLRLGSAELTSLISRSRLAELGMIEPAAVIHSVNRIRAGARESLPALNRLLSAELWVCGLEWPATGRIG